MFHDALDYEFTDTDQAALLDVLEDQDLEAGREWVDGPFLFGDDLEDAAANETLTARVSL